MAIGPDRRYMTAAQADVTQYDVGLRQYMLRVYNYMAGGVALTGVVAYAFQLALASNTDLLYLVYGTPIKWVLAFAPLAFSLFFSFRVDSMAASTAQTLFWAFAAVMGLSLA